VAQQSPLACRIRLSLGAGLRRFGADFLIKGACDHAGLRQAVSVDTLRRSYNRG